MFLSSVRACPKARKPATIPLLGSFSRTAYAAPLRRRHGVQLGLSRLAQQREYAALDRNGSKAACAQTLKPAEEGQAIETLNLESRRRQLIDAYKTPTTGFISYLPKAWIPYGELARLDKPTGTFLLWLPCAFSTILAGTMASPMVAAGEICATVALFLAGAFVMRGAGCTVNDLWDRNLDPYVERTKFRPIARGAVTPLQASTFLGAQLLAGLAVLLQFPTSCLYYGIPSLLLVGIYPLMKRVTNYPQVVLGLTFSWGAIMGFPAIGIDIFSDVNALCTAACLYLSCVAWTTNYDMVYAHMDIKDDVKIGIKSIARAHANDTKVVLSGLATAQIILLAAAAHFAGATFFIPLLFPVAGANLLLIHAVDLKNVKSCLWYFKNSAKLTGGLIVSGLFLTYAVEAHNEKVARVNGPKR
jgi:4-hydroxybenzoate polyprenyltransferase